MATRSPKSEGDIGPIGCSCYHRAPFPAFPGTPTVCVSVWAMLRLYFDDTG